jgi:hypothetical protein
MRRAAPPKSNCGGFSFSCSLVQFGQPAPNGPIEFHPKNFGVIGNDYCLQKARAPSTHVFLHKHFQQRFLKHVYFGNIEGRRAAWLYLGRVISLAHPRIMLCRVPRSHCVIFVLEWQFPVKKGEGNVDRQKAHVRDCNCKISRVLRRVPLQCFSNDAPVPHGWNAGVMFEEMLI